MTTRELWRSIMFYGAFDRMPVIHWATWPETQERWRREGLPENANAHEYFGAVPQWHRIWLPVGLYPHFERIVLEETAEYRVFRAGDGVVQKEWKTKSCIPHYTDFTLKSAADWPEYKKRLQPDPARFPPKWDDNLREAETSSLPVAIGTASMMGWIRNWMGVENMSYLMFDDRDCYADMVNTLADLTCWALDQTLPKMKVKPEMGFGWEDICGKSGPLVSPEIFRECVAPGYRKMRNKLEEHGVKLLGIDSDGLVEPLLADWLEAGVNVQFPIERGTWNARPEDIRKCFGKELRIIGGLDKLALEKGRAAIDREVDARVGLMQEGGYIVMPDHLITPGVPLEDYKYYLERIRALRL